MKLKNNLANISLYVFMTIAAVIVVIPILWMFFSSFKGAAEILKLPATFLPQDFTFESWKAAFDYLPLWRLLFNTLLVTMIIVIGQVLTSAIIGYVFAKYKFLFKETLFMLILTRMMIPIILLVIPLYWLVGKFGWFDSYTGLTIPWLVTSFGIFMMRQFMSSIPDELMEAARIDGCSEFRIFLKIILPSSTSALAALAVLVFVWEWNQFLWPLLIIMSNDMQTLPLGLSSVISAQFARYDIAMPAASFATIPAVIFYIFFQKYLTQGVTMSGLKE